MGRDPRFVAQCLQFRPRDLDDALGRKKGETDVEHAGTKREELELLLFEEAHVLERIGEPEDRGSGQLQLGGDLRDTHRTACGGNDLQDSQATMQTRDEIHAVIFVLCLGIVVGCTKSHAASLPLGYTNDPVATHCASGARTESAVSHYRPEWHLRYRSGASGH